MACEVNTSIATRCWPASRASARPIRWGSSCRRPRRFPIRTACACVWRKACGRRAPSSFRPRCRRCSPTAPFRRKGAAGRPHPACWPPAPGRCGCSNRWGCACRWKPSADTTCNGAASTWRPARCCADRWCRPTARYSSCRCAKVCAPGARWSSPASPHPRRRAASRCCARVSRACSRRPRPCPPKTANPPGWAIALACPTRCPCSDACPTTPTCGRPSAMAISA